MLTFNTHRFCGNIWGKCCFCALGKTVFCSGDWLSHQKNFPKKEKEKKWGHFGLKQLVYLLILKNIPLEAPVF
jgi:hypothetical protein